MYMVVVQHVTYGTEFAVSWQYQMDKATRGGGGGGGGALTTNCVYL